MPSPNNRRVHIDQALTNISIAYLQDDSHFIAERVFPSVSVEHKSDEYYIFEKEMGRRDLVLPRKSGAESAGSGFDISTDVYLTQTYAYHKDLDWELVDNSDPQLDLESTATEFVSRLFLLNRERAWVSKYFTTGVWSTDVTGVAAAPGAGQFLQWNDGASDPKADIDAAKFQFLLETGFEPNKLTLGFKVFQTLTNHPLIRDQFKYTSSESITTDMIAKFLDIGEILVSKASYVTSPKGVTVANAMVAGNNALLTYSPASAGLMEPAAGYTFVWSGISGQGTPGVAMRNFPMEHLKSDRIEGEYAYVDKVVGADLGYFFASAVA